MNTGRTGTLSFYVEDVADVKSIMEAGLEQLIETSVNFTAVREFQSQLIRMIKMYCVTVLLSQIHDTVLHRLQKKSLLLVQIIIFSPFHSSTITYNTTRVRLKTTFLNKILFLITFGQ